MTTYPDIDHLGSFDRRMMSIALSEASMSEFRHFKTGCVIAYRGHVLSSAHNDERTSPAQKRYNRLRDIRDEHGNETVHKTHAEIRAIQGLSYTALTETDWKRARVYVARIASGLTNGVGLARPCPACMGALRDMGIRDVFYTCDGGGVTRERIWDER